MGPGRVKGLSSLADRPDSRKGPFLQLSSPPKTLIFLNSSAAVPVMPGYLRFYVRVIIRLHAFKFRQLHLVSKAIFSHEKLHTNLKSKVIAS